VQIGVPDKETESLSVFNVVEIIRLTTVPPEVSWTENVSRLEPMVLVAEWMIDSEEDYKHQFDYEYAAVIPGSDEPVQLATGQFHFEAGKPRQRFF